MRVLSLDTTTAEGSVALVFDHTEDVRRGDASRTHAERLPRELFAPLRDRGLTAADVDLFAVACGPGSFTGLRIGIATMQGLAMVEKRPLVGISALDALAHLAAAELEPGTVVGAWMDAHRREVFSSLYRVTSSAAFSLERLVELDPASVGDPAATLARWSAALRPDVMVGDGAELYREMIEQAGGAGIAVSPHSPLAGAIGRLGAARAGRGERPSAADIRPLYIRRPDAEIARDKARPRTPVAGD
jgi:tRNA threonylcarbamoyladenosine biosynthesis protein TsaB